MISWFGACADVRIKKSENAESKSCFMVWRLAMKTKQ
jgi:hypothetical protein